MTDESLKDESSDVQYSLPAKDSLLVDFVRWANRGVSISVTLSVKGTIYSGNVIGGAEWCNQIIAAAAKLHGSEDNKTAFVEYFHSVKDNLYTDLKDDFDDVGFIHLKDVRVYQGSQPIKLPETLWRLKIGEVDGFTIGLWSAS
ncbi:hypothetical protein [Pantoea coffeiphila]|uniref:hypothetical protein n=1 Tax=Pantoea coffeiphila TaxID=1465635 RepID=UPI0019620BAE|nr:hypothetical protein [Pantoea coffeiphila]MBM7346050.1 hypothetical protein [Pantoea coffeiphila]